MANKRFIPEFLRFTRPVEVLESLGDVQRLPLPSVYTDILKKNPDGPIKNEDFLRVKNFFAEQKLYFEALAQEGDADQTEVALAFARRVPELYAQIVVNLRVITKNDFEASLPKMKRIIQDFEKTASVTSVFLDGKSESEAQNHSTHFINVELQTDPDKFSLVSDFSNPALKEQIRSGKRKIIIADDAAYSGQNILLHLLDIERALGFELGEKQVLINLVGITNSAFQRISEQYGSKVRIHSQYRIPELKEFFQPDDYAILRYMKRTLPDGDNQQILTRGDEVLTFFWQKVPDNFCHPLRKWDNRYWDGKQHHYFPGYLVDDMPGGIHPSYRAGKKFMHS